MIKEEAVEILSDIRAEYNIFGTENEATRYHALSWAIQAMTAEPKHGRWKHHQYGNTEGYYECDNCGKINSYKSNYCPKCGTKMDGGENG